MGWKGVGVGWGGCGTTCIHTMYIQVGQNRLSSEAPLQLSLYEMLHNMAHLSLTSPYPLSFRAIGISKRESQRNRLGSTGQRVHFMWFIVSVNLVDYTCTVRKAIACMVCAIGKPSSYQDLSWNILLTVHVLADIHSLYPPKFIYSPRSYKPSP